MFIGKKLRQQLRERNTMFIPKIEFEIMREELVRLKNEQIALQDELRALRSVTTTKHDFQMFKDCLYIRSYHAHFSSHKMHVVNAVQQIMKHLDLEIKHESEKQAFTYLVSKQD
jgi:hypothetical protein